MWLGAVYIVTPLICSHIFDNMFVEFQHEVSLWLSTSTIVSQTCYSYPTIVKIRNEAYVCTYLPLWYMSICCSSLELRLRTRFQQGICKAWSQSHMGAGREGCPKFFSSLSTLGTVLENLPLLFHFTYFRFYHLQLLHFRMLGCGTIFTEKQPVWMQVCCQLAPPVHIWPYAQTGRYLPA